MPATPRSPAAPPAGPALCLLETDRCHYSLCLPARMVEAAPGLRAVAARLQAILQTATRAPVPLTAERAPRSLFLLLDLDPHRTASHATAYALQQQGPDVLISGKNATAVALGVAQLLRELGFSLQADGRVVPPKAPPDGRLVWLAHDLTELAPTADPAWLAALGAPPAR